MRMFLRDNVHAFHPSISAAKERGLVSVFLEALLLTIELFSDCSSFGWQRSWGAHRSGRWYGILSAEPLIARRAHSFKPQTPPPAPPICFCFSACSPAANSCVNPTHADYACRGGEDDGLYPPADSV